MNSTTFAFALCFVFFCAACATGPQEGAATPEGISSSELAGEWNIDLLEGSPVTDHGTVFLGFGDDGRIYGNTSVNRLLGSWTLDAGALELGMLGSTRMAGPPALMQQESRILAALERAVRAERRDDGRLVLLSADGMSLITASRR